MKRTAIIDADSLVYMAALGVEYEWEVDEHLWLLWSEIQPAIARLETLLQLIQEETQADRMVMALTDYTSPNWRLGVMPTYKRNRKKVRRPIVWKPLRDYLEDTRECFIRPTLEGDDVCGILMTHPRLIRGEKLCVSIDKDMMTVPGMHYTLHQIRDGDLGNPRIFEVTKADADRFHLLQALAGDAVDGYGGAPGWGMVRAEKLLDEGRVLEPREHTFTRGQRKGETEIRWEPGEPGTPWDVVVSAYQQSGLGEGVALANARVARILHSADFNFEKKEVILWEP